MAGRDDKSDILTRACKAVEEQRLGQASTILATEYPFTPLINAGRKYSFSQCMEVFVRDGFVDRYSGRRLVFPGTLRLLSLLLPLEFPFHANWKSDACHFAFWELFPTIDHVVPVSRGGLDREDNWVSTSMVLNAAKANFTLEELGWTLHQADDTDRWDGLTGWFMRQTNLMPELRSNIYVRRWQVAAEAVLGPTHGGIEKTRGPKPKPVTSSSEDQPKRILDDE